MRPFLALITVAALGAGLAAGYLDHKRTQEGIVGARKVSLPSLEPAKSPAAEAPVPKPEPKTPLPEPEAKTPPPKEEDIATLLKKIEAQILREDFQAASRAADEFTSAYRDHPEAAVFLERLRRAERKSRAYAALVGPLESRRLPETLHDVVLLNGNTFTAKSVKEEAGNYEMDHVLGGKATLPKDQVKGLQPVPLAKYHQRRWKEIEAKVNSYRDPMDLFFFGVRKCFRDGMREEGIRLVDRLLGMPESGQVVALYASDSSGQAARWWEQAAGRAPLEPLAVPRRPPLGRAVGSAESGTGVGAEGAEEETVDATAIARAAELVDLAESIYRDAGGNPGNVFDARTRALAVTKLLYALPAQDPRVQQLMERTRELLGKVMKE